jgi:hypothetical protein
MNPEPESNWLVNIFVAVCAILYVVYIVALLFLACASFAVLLFFLTRLLDKLLILLTT